MRVGAIGLAGEREGEVRGEEEGEGLDEERSSKGVSILAWREREGEVKEGEEEGEGVGEEGEEGGKGGGSSV